MFFSNFYVHRGSILHNVCLLSGGSFRRSPGLFLLYRSPHHFYGHDPRHNCDHCSLNQPFFVNVHSGCPIYIGFTIRATHGIWLVYGWAAVSFLKCLQSLYHGRHLWAIPSVGASVMSVWSSLSVTVAFSASAVLSAQNMLPLPSEWCAFLAQFALSPLSVPYAPAVPSVLPVRRNWARNMCSLFKFCHVSRSGKV